MTIEDPIEVLHPDKQSIVNQREIGTDTDDFHTALKRVLRQDPDVILIGEMRDPETVWAALVGRRDRSPRALDAAHDGRDRDDQPHHRLLPAVPAAAGADVARDVAAGDHLAAAARARPTATAGCRRWRSSSPPVASSTRSPTPTQTHELEEIIADGEFYGMQTFDQSLRNLYEQGIVTRRDALATATNPHDLRLKLDHLELTRAEAPRPRRRRGASRRQPT